MFSQCKSRSRSPFASLPPSIRPFVTPLVVFVVFMSVVGGTLAVNDPIATEQAPAVLAKGIPVAVSGTLVGAADGRLALREAGAESAVAFGLDARADVLRGGEMASFDALRAGDQVRMTVDGATGRVLRVDAQPTARTAFAPSNELALLAAIGFVSGGVALAHRRGQTARLVPSGERRLVGGAGRAAVSAGDAALARLAGRRPERVGAGS